MSNKLSQILEILFDKKKDEPISKELDEYRHELKMLYEKSNDLFEKQLSYISGGALGLSIIIIENVFKDISTTVWKLCLVLSWIFFGAALITNLISNTYAANKHYQTMREIRDNEYNREKAEKRGEQIKTVNGLSISFLLLGLIFFVIYISINILFYE